MEATTEDLDPFTRMVIGEEMETTEETDVEEPAEQPEDVEETPDEGDDASEEEGEFADTDEDDADDAESEPEPEYFTVTVDGEQKQVTRDELLRGYSGQQYIQKGMQENAQARKEFEAKMQELQNAEAETRKLYEQLTTTGVAQQPTPPDPDDFADDPIGLMNAQARFQADLHAYQGQAKQLSELQERQKREQETARAAVLHREAELLKQAIPEFQDADKAPAAWEGLMRAGEAHGVSREELQGIADHRLFIVLDKARRYDALKAKKPEPSSATKVVKTKKRSNVSSTERRRDEAAAKMRKTGRPEDVDRWLISGVK